MQTSSDSKSATRVHLIKFQQLNPHKSLDSSCSLQPGSTLNLSPESCHSTWIRCSCALCFRWSNLTQIRSNLLTTKPWFKFRQIELFFSSLLTTPSGPPSLLREHNHHVIANDNRLLLTTIISFPPTGVLSYIPALVSSSSTSGEADLSSSILNVLLLVADFFLSPWIFLLWHYSYHRYHDLLLHRRNSNWCNVHLASSEIDTIGFGVRTVHSKESYRLEVRLVTCKKDSGKLQVLHLDWNPSSNRCFILGFASIEGLFFSSSPSSDIPFSTSYPSNFLMV